MLLLQMGNVNGSDCDFGNACRQESSINKWGVCTIHSLLRLGSNGYINNIREPAYMFTALQKSTSGHGEAFASPDGE